MEARLLKASKTFSIKSKEKLPKIRGKDCNPYNERHSEHPTDRTRKEHLAQEK